MNKSVIIIDHDKYSNLNEFLLGLEEGFVNGEDSFYTVIVTGKTDPLSSRLFSKDAYSTLVRMDETAKRYRKKIEIQINTRMPAFLDNRSLKDLFHIFPVGINYYITNSNYDNLTKLANLQGSIKKLETWDFKNPLKTKIIIDIDEQIHRDRLNEIKLALNNTVIYIEKSYYTSFRLTNSNEEKIKILLT